MSASRRFPTKKRSQVLLISTTSTRSSPADVVSTVTLRSEFIREKPDEGFEFKNSIVGGAIPKEYIPKIEEGIVEAMENGPIAGYQVVDVGVELYDGSYHEVDSSEMAFKIAASMAFREAAKKAKPVLLEPIMKVEVTVPEDYMGDVIGDISSRRGRIEGSDMNMGAVAIRAFVPLSEMFGYATDLRSKTQGRGVYVMQMDHFEKLPDNLNRKNQQNNAIMIKTPYYGRK